MFVKFNSSDIATIKTNSYGMTIRHIAGTREWEVLRDSQCVKICDTKRQAMNYINGRR